MRITANMVTMTRIVLMPIPGYLLYGGADSLLAALALIIVLGLTDWLDGIMARREGPSTFGGLLDPMADKIFIAVVYLPLTERGVIPLTAAVCIFVREFVVTSLRTSLALRDAPMRTSKLAKYKTGIQMTAVGYVILFTAAPDAWYTWAIIIGVLGIPLGLMIARLARGEKQGPRSSTLLALMGMAVVSRWRLGVDLSILLYVLVVTGITLVSGFSYLADAWSALKGKRGSGKELCRFALDGVLVPGAFVLLLGLYKGFGMSALVILVVTLELAVGGLTNLLASKHVVPRFRWMAAKSTAQLALAFAALAAWHFGGPSLARFGEACIAASFALTAAYVVYAFYRHRRSYLGSF
ncbi:MAG: CDP-alcohol phosphatidyltransferase family protein [Deltaproteobacteria bacterium]|nr:CDP-alcohol phosphatidyltransferase family protein [Deltaproteobacteria bacterium]